MSFSYNSLLATSSLVVDDIQTNGLIATNASINTLRAQTMNLPTLTASKLVGTDTSNNLTSVTLSGASSNIIVANPSVSSITVDLGSTLSVTTLNTSSTYMVNNTMTVSQINTIIANTAYTYIYFKPGTYIFTSALLIARSNIVLDGCNGATLTLGKYANQPVVCIGDTATNPATIRYYNITIRNFKIDGNKSFMSAEFWSAHTWIPNSGISAMMISQLYIDECNLDNCISAGLTLVNLIDDCTVIKCSSTLNYFDAYTFYGSTNLKIISCHAYNHTNGAGLSFDNNNTNIIISNCTIGNNKESIFARDSYNVIVSGCIMNYNTQQGVFLAGYSDVGNDRGCERWTFNNNTINYNGSQGIWFQSCKKFTITGNTISNNYGNGCEWGNDTPGSADGTCSYNVLSSNIINNNGGAGIYNNTNNSYTSGARDNLMCMNIVKNNTGGAYTGDYTAVTVDDAEQLNTTTLTVRNNSGNYCNISANATGNSTVVLPGSNGTSGQLLATDGTGNTSWSTPTIVSATAFHIGTGTASSGTLTYDSACSNASTGIISALGASQAVPTNPKGWLTLTIAGQGTVAVPFFDQFFT